MTCNDRGWCDCLTYKFSVNLDKLVYDFAVLHCMWIHTTLIINHNICKSIWIKDDGPYSLQQ